MAKYRKKPVIIDAWLWDGKEMTLKTLITLGMNPTAWDIDAKKPNEDRNVSYLRINTLEGSVTVNVGEYIICGVKGEFYPCKADIFAKTYESVE